MYLFEYGAAACWAQDTEILVDWLAEYTPSEQRRISELCSVLPAEHQPTAREAIARALANANHNTRIAEAIAGGFPALCHVKAPNDVVIVLLLSANPGAVDLDANGQLGLAFAIGGAR